MQPSATFLSGDKRLKALDLVFFLSAAGLFLFVLSHAWLADDAYITFRVADNFLNGYGLRWNIDERVQVYTHPLWLLLHIPFYALFGNIYLTTIGLSAALGVLAVYWLAKASSGREYSIILIFIPLALSKTFKDFLICGLEAPLTLCLFSYFLHLFLQEKQKVYRLFFIASLLVITRFDNLIALLPFLALLAWRHKPLCLARLVTAWLPFLLWSLFSLFYYGFIFPNTKYAKLNTGLDTGDYIQQGFHYLTVYLYYDFTGAVVILAALAIGILQFSRDRSSAIIPLCLSIAFSVAYVIAVGGDFMAGRFFILPFFLSLWVIVIRSRDLSRKHLLQLVYVVPFLYLIHYQVLYPQFKNPRYGTPNAQIARLNYGIVDERRFYAADTWLVSRRGWRLRMHPGGLGVRFGILASHDKNRTVRLVRDDVIGIFGYYAGPRVVIIDRQGLADPLLARLPINDLRKWRIGHFKRKVPEGYKQVRETDNLDAMDGDLAAYYEKLRLITQGNLFDMERLAVIVAFQLGEYDYLLESYLSTS